MESPKRIAVIGAGPSGLTSIKCVKEEGMEATCFEKTSNFGGRWRYRENHVPGVASIMKSTISIFSKEMIAFSDFPPPAHYPNYFHNQKMIDYLHLYAQHFNLLSCIRYQEEVIRIIPATDYNESGKWLLTSIRNGNEMTESFDGVMVCTGRLSYPHKPEFPNIKAFKGKVFHSQELKVATDFENLDVLVIGNGNSAIDTAVEISTFTKQVYLSTRSGTWIFPKLGPRGLPFDLAFIRRYICVLNKYFKSTINHFVEQYLEKKFQHNTYRLKPNNRAMDQNLVMNDILPDKILTGRICIKGKISSFQERGVFFEGEEKLTEVDVVVLATGYEVKIPFLQDEVYKNVDGKFSLINNVIPSSLKHKNLALIGFIDTQGPLSPVSECQARWVARIFSKKLKSPTEFSGKLTDYQTSSDSLRENYMEYMDNLAEEIGAKLNMSTLLFKDPSLYWMCLTGPFLSYQYRLTGPHSWNHSRKVIMDCYERVTSSLLNK